MQCSFHDMKYINIQNGVRTFFHQNGSCASSFSHPFTRGNDNKNANGPQKYFTLQFLKLHTLLYISYKNKDNCFSRKVLKSGKLLGEFRGVATLGSSRHVPTHNFHKILSKICIKLNVYFYRVFNVFFKDRK